jgi:hypothetical protein
MPLVLIGVIVVLFAILLLALQRYGDGQLRAGFPGGSDSPEPSTRIVDQKYECTADCGCEYPASSTSPMPQSRDNRTNEEATWTSCVSLKEELWDDYEAACRKACERQGGSFTNPLGVGPQCNRIGDC